MSHMHSRLRRADTLNFLHVPQMSRRTSVWRLMSDGGVRCRLFAGDAMLELDAIT